VVPSPGNWRSDGGIGREQVGDLEYQACGLYTPGHHVHFIQAKKAWEGDQANYRNGRLVSVDDGGWITVEVGADILRFWNHDPKRAKLCFAASAGHVGLPGWGLLHAPDKGDRYCICVSTEGPTPCVPPPPPTTDPAELVKQLETYGGFMVEGKGILQDLERRRRRH
jgi:hypothetical protein